MSRSRHFRTLLLGMAVCACALAQTPITFQYLYDDIGQLVKVVDSTGIVIEYVYDAVGNMLDIKRSTVVPGALSVFGFTPQQSGPLSLVTINGQGFSTTPSANTVRFNGVAAIVVSATATTLVVAVPAGATSGTISVSVGTATAVSSAVFTVAAVPVINSITPKGALANTALSLTVTGINLTGSTFAFLPAFVPPAITIGAVSINPAGTSATLGLTIAANAIGKFALVATNASGSSTAFLTSGNTFTVVSSSAASMDSDGDGLSDAQEVAIGSDPFNPDTDGDGFPDGVEVASGSDPLNPLCTPFNCRASGETLSVSVSVANFIGTPSAPHEADGVFSVVNFIGTTSAPHEADSFLFSVVNTGGAAALPLEADSRVYWLVNTAPNVTASSLSSLSSPQGAQADSARHPPGGGIDTDGDGLTDEQERQLGTDPFAPDTDGDGFPDGLEVALGSNPLDASSLPDIRPPGILTGPLLDIRSFVILNQPAEKVVQPRKGVEHVAKAPAPRKRGRIASGRFHLLR